MAAHTHGVNNGDGQIKNLQMTNLVVVMRVVVLVEVGMVVLLVVGVVVGWGG